MTEITSKLSTALADRYKIERHLGEGGMATVYLAEDLKHKRKVAVKVLRPELAAVLGAERFVQEITTTANLQHPHILPLFDSGEADSFLYYVMPYIEGETLRDKLNRETQLGIEEAVSITTDIADALDYAHRQNVIHRDIKPENILLHEGRPMVADFGIALAVSAAAGGRMTETGLSLGTPHYMSPEQATAEKDLTNRSDIYSLGSVLYEMLTGEPPHMGNSAQQIIMKIVSEDVQPVTALRKSVPPHVAAATTKSLEKLAADRFESAAKFAEALANPAFMLPTAPGTAMAGAPASGPWNRLTIATTALAALFFVVALWAFFWPSPPPQLARFGITMPVDAPVNSAQNGGTVAVSPDGTQIVYVGPNRRLFVRPVDELESRPLPGTDQAHSPFFSPDGQWVGFFATGQLKKVPLGGGPPLTITDSAAAIRGVSWGPDDIIVYTPSNGPMVGLWSIPAGGGAATQLTTVDSDVGEGSHRWPDILPGGKAAVFTVFGNGGTTHLAVVSLETKEVKHLALNGIAGRYAESGHLVYVTSEGALVAVTFDADGLEVTGNPVSLIEGVLTKATAAPEFTLSRNGFLVYLSGSQPDRALVAVDRNGVEVTLAEGLKQANAPRFSPDGRLIAMELAEAGNQDIWVYDIAQGTNTRFTFEGSNRYPGWSPDGTRIGFSSSRESAVGRQLFWKPSDGSGVAELLYEGDGEQWEHFWARDGESLLLRRTMGGRNGRDLWYTTLDQPDSARALAATEFNERAPVLSPDDRWVAYVSNESGRDEVYVRPLHGPGGKRQISTEGGTEPMWSPKGRELFYRSADGLVVALVDTEQMLRVGTRRVLFDDGGYVTNTDHTNYDVRPTSGQFVFVRGSADPTDLVVVLNFFEELKAKVGN